MDTLKILVTVKAYPAISRRRGECVCVAGIDVERPRWIRLFPVPFRDMRRDSKFRKYDIIEVRATKARTDPRPESFEPNADSITVVDHLPASKHEARRGYVEPLIGPSMCAIRRERGQHGASVGAFRPAAPPLLRVEEDREPRDPAKQARIDQPSLLMPTKAGLEKIPYKFIYSYRCADEPACRGHEQSIADWEISEAFRRWRRDHGEQGAIEHIQKKWGEEIWAPSRDAVLFVGNQWKNPDGFLVLGVFWPPRSTGGGPSGAEQGELLPRR